MKIKYVFARSIYAWFGVFLITTAIAVVTWPKAVIVQGVPFLVNWYSILNAGTLLILFVFLHYLVFTNQAVFEDFSIFAIVFVIWVLVMIAMATSPAWWISHMAGGGIIFLGIESYVPTWPHSLKEWVKKKFVKRV